MRSHEAECPARQSTGVLGWSCTCVRPSGSECIPLVTAGSHSVMRSRNGSLQKGPSTCHHYQATMCPRSGDAVRRALQRWTWRLHRMGSLQTFPQPLQPTSQWCLQQEVKQIAAATETKRQVCNAAAKSLLAAHAAWWHCATCMQVWTPRQ